MFLAPNIYRGATPKFLDLHYKTERWFRATSHDCFHIGELRQQTKTKSRAVIDRGLDMGADMKTAVL